MGYSKHYNARKTPQTQAIPGRDMVQNRAGGFGFAVSNWEQLNRFLILGTEGGTYYAKEKSFTVENCENVKACIAENGLKTVWEIVTISQSGRAPKNNPAIFALAMCVAFGNQETRMEALLEMPKVCRIGTHLFHFMEYCKALGVNSNRSFRKAIAEWYNGKDAKTVAYQVLKYQGRTVEQGVKSTRWTHKDVLRLAHPKPRTQDHSTVFNWAIYGNMEASRFSPVGSKVLEQIWAFERAKTETSESILVNLILDYRLTHEMVPNHWKNSPEVWEALLQRMPLGATLRNLGKLTSVGLLKPLSHAATIVQRRLTNQEYLRKSRLHPLSILVAMKTYAQGHGMKGKNTWSPVTQVVDALDDAFYLAFGNVEATGKRTMLAVDISGSMTWQNIAGMPITPREASAAMALITARVEPNCAIVAFCHTMVDIKVSPRMRLDDVINTVERMRMGGTDCALPMKHALNNGMGVDTFVIYTDTETWYGDIHPVQALNIYRQKTGIPAKLISCAMIAPDYDIVDPNDPGMLGVTGFDTATPQIIAEFAKG